MSRRKDNEETDKQTRIAIVSDDKCKPKRCRQECKKSCPVVRMGKLCIEVAPWRQRLVAAKVIKRYILHAKKTGFVVEHDFIMATYLADRVIVEDQPSVKTTAFSPQSLLNVMNRFWELLGITFRRDPNNFRKRINKNASVKDTEQKRSGQFFFLENHCH